MGIARNGGTDGGQASEGAPECGKLKPGAAELRELEQLIGFAYHLVLMNKLLAGWRLQEIEAAILAATALAAYGRDDELHGVDAQRIARELLYPAYEMRLEDALAALVLGLDKPPYR